MRLASTYPDHVAELHRRASDWYAGNDLPNEAVTHALAIQDWSRAAEIIERFSDQWPMRGEIRTLLGWLESFPAEIWLKRVRLGVNYAWALFMANQFERADQLLDQLMPLAQNSPPILGELFAIRVMVAAFRYDMPAVIELAQQALSRVPPEEASPRSRILLSLGVVYYEMGGDISAAKGAFREAYELGKALAPSNNVGNAPLPLTALAYLAEIEWLQGNLRDASRMYEQALELAEQYGGQPSIALCFVHWGRASLLYEWNELDEARHALQESIRIGELWKRPRFLVRPYGLSALVMLAGGQLGEASAMIRRAEQITRDAHPTPPTLGSLALHQILLWMAQNDFQAITKWEQRPRFRMAIPNRARARASGNCPGACVHEALLPARRQFCAEAGARADRASPGTNPSQRLDLPCRCACSSSRRWPYTPRGKPPPPSRRSNALLALAEPENYIRSFLDIGKPMEEFLSWSLESPALSEPHLRLYVSRLLSHFAADLPSKSSQPAGSTLIEPLTERELEVLRLIAQGLSNREISERLFLALSTVKGYNRIIFDKLQVQRRTEAIARARQLGLL